MFTKLYCSDNQKTHKEEDDFLDSRYDFKII